MADLTARTLHKSAPNAGRGSYQVADGVTVVEGMLAQLQSGYLNHWDETGVFLGLLLAGDDRAGTGIILGETSDTPPPEARVDESGVILMRLAGVAGTPSQAKVGDFVYCATSNPDDMTMTSTGNRPVGRLKRFRATTDVDVQLLKSTHVAQSGIAALTENATSIGGSQDDNFATLATAWDGSTYPTAAESALLIDAIRETAAKVNEMLAAS